MSGGHQPKPRAAGDPEPTPPTGGSGVMPPPIPGKPVYERGTRLATDWEPQGFPADTVAYRIAVAMDPTRFQWELERFKAYWHAKPGKKAQKVDWQSAWVHWVLNTRRYEAPRR